MAETTTPSTFPLLAFYASGVYLFFIAHDYLQELIFHFPGYKFPQFMTLFEFASCVIFPFFEILIRRIKLSGRNPLHYSILSFIILPSMVMGTAAIQYVSYPIKVVAKSTKLLPTMAMGTLLLGRRFNIWHYCAATCLCLGLAGFAFTDGQGKESNSTMTIGILLLGASVCLDSCTPNVQQKLLGNTQSSDSKASEAEVMMYSNLFGCLLLIPASLLTGELTEAVKFVSINPQALVLLSVFAVTSFGGVAAYLRLVSHFSGVTAVAVTTTRKVVTVVLSFVLFPNKVARWGHIGSGAVLLFGIVLNERARRVEKRRQPPPSKTDIERPDQQQKAQQYQHKMSPQSASESPSGLTESADGQLAPVASAPELGMKF